MVLIIWNLVDHFHPKMNRFEVSIPKVFAFLSLLFIVSLQDLL